MRRSRIAPMTQRLAGLYREETACSRVVVVAQVLLRTREILVTIRGILLNEESANAYFALDAL